jgi:ribonuclease VapC
VAGAVLDSYALLAFFRGEPSARVVEKMLHDAARQDHPLHMTEVNYADLKYILLKKDGPEKWREVEALVEGLPIEFHPATRELADLAAIYKATYRLSLADAFAAALAKEKKAELVTGDPEFKPLEKEIKILWLAAQT